MKLIQLDQIIDNKKIVITDDMVTVYYMKFAKGEGLANHSKNGIGIIQVLDGKIHIEFDNGESFELKRNDLLEFKASIVHSVKAMEDSKLILFNASYSN
ncbi:MAG: hypothetical protein Q4F97_03660 [Bacteroidales bacterium]|nr:hypothetical protein [Bacteroidales bacterium]